MKIIALHFLFFLFPIVLCSQNISGQLIEEDTGDPVQFANMGVLSREVGTVSDEWGKFNLKLHRVSNSDTLKISMIGFESKEFLVGDFKTLCREDCVIKLKKRNYELKEIVVVPKNYVSRIVGNKVKNKNTSTGFESNELGCEMGVRMKIKRRPTYIDKVYLTFSDCQYDSIFYRLNIYEMKGKMPTKNLLAEPIYLQFSKEEVLAGITVNLLEHNIYVENDFLVSLELVKDLGELGLYFASGILNGNTYFRKVSVGRWSKVGFTGIGIQAKILQER